MICLHDTCVAVSPERHEAALACFRGYCDSDHRHGAEADPAMRLPILRLTPGNDDRK